jgi:hypothetical protein
VDYPTPDDLMQAPVWDNYVVAQASAAAIGLIPSYAHALGVRVSGYDVSLVVQASDGSRVKADEDVEDIRSDLETLLGPRARVTVEVAATVTRRLRPDDGVCWFFGARV